MYDSAMLLETFDCYVPHGLSKVAEYGRLLASCLPHKQERDSVLYDDEHRQDLAECNHILGVVASV